MRINLRFVNYKMDVLGKTNSQLFKELTIPFESPFKNQGNKKPF